MDSDGSVSIFERTFWTVWYYISEAVNRFLRPEPPQTARNDVNSFQDSSVDGEPPSPGNADVGISKEEDEEQPVATVSLRNSSEPLVPWDVGSTDAKIVPEIENTQHKSQLSRCSERKASEEGEATREEQFTQTGSNDADLSRDEKEDGRQQNTDPKLYADGRDKQSGSTVVADIAPSEGTEDTGKNTDDEQGPGQVEGDEGDFTDYCRSYKWEAEESRAMLTEQSDMCAEKEELQTDDEDMTWVRVEVDNTDYVLHQASGSEPETQLPACNRPSDNDSDCKGEQSVTLSDTVPHVELQNTVDNRGMVSDDDAQTFATPEQTMADRSQGLVNCKAEEDHEEEEAVAERERGAEEEENVDEVTEQTKDEEESEQREDDGRRTECSRREEGFTLNVNAEKLSTGGEHGEQENNDVLMKAIMVDEELFVMNNDGKDKDVSREQPCTSSLGTAKHKGQEECTANIPQGQCEGQGVVWPGLNSTTYKETQEGVPEYNNEPEPDGNTTQRFLEAGDYTEFRTTHLPEEVESNTQESLQNWNKSSGADFMLARAHMEQERQPETIGTEVLRNVFEEENTGILSLTNERPLTELEESGCLSEDRSGPLLDDSMKTGFEYFEKEFEIHFGSDNETDKATKDHQEELLVDIEINEGLCAAERREMTATEDSNAGPSDCTMTCLEDKVKKTTCVNNSCETYTGLHTDFAQSGFLKNSADANGPWESSIEIPDAGIGIEEDTCGDVERMKEGGDITQKEIISCQEVEAQIMTEKDGAFNTGFGLNEYTNTESKSDNSLDFSDNEMEMKPEVGQGSVETESPSKDTGHNLTHVTESEAGYTCDSISVCQDGIDEEILDLWIQTALSADDDDLRQQEVAGPRRGTATEVDVKLRVEKMKEVEVSPPFSHANAPSSSAGCLDQCLDGWRIQNNNNHLLESPPSLPDHMLGKASEPSELSLKQPGFEHLLIDIGASDLEEEQINTETGFHRDISQRLDDLPEEAAEANVESLNNIRSALEEEPPETPGSPGDIVDTDSGRSSDAETSNVIPLDQMPSLDKPRLDWSETDEPEPGVKKDDPPQPGHQVDVHVLDFTPQKSRIAVKNSRVRPPKDPRSLLHKPSLDPSPSTPRAANIPVGVSLGGLGIGIKLPGLGAGSPILKKTEKAVREESHPNTSSQEAETKPEKDDDAPKRDSQHKPKWLPPGSPGFGNPFMSELKTKLKKTTKE